MAVKIDDLTITKGTGTVLTINAGGKYVAEDSYFNIDAASASPAYSGGMVNVQYYPVNTGITTSYTNTSGVCYEPRVQHTVSPVTYYQDVEGWLSKSAGDVAFRPGGGAAYFSKVYLTGVNIPKPSSGTYSFSITVPNGNSTATFVFNVDASGNVTITES